MKSQTTCKITYGYIKDKESKYYSINANGENTELSNISESCNNYLGELTSTFQLCIDSSTSIGPFIDNKTQYLISNENESHPFFTNQEITNGNNEYDNAIIAGVKNIYYFDNIVEGMLFIF